MSPLRAPLHVPVLPVEVLATLGPQPGESWVDCTAGGGGHTRAIARLVGDTGRVIALDQDAAMLAMARTVEQYPNITWIEGNFDQLAAILQEVGVSKVDGVLADLGFSSDQLDDAARGLSFRQDGPLDMRLNPAATLTAADIVNTWDEAELANAIYEYGEERKSRWVAKKIVERRSVKRFETTTDLANVVRSCVPRSGTMDSATRTFQALRIAVNDELGVLDRLLAVLPAVVAPGGRVGVISFHSLEDRRVKWAFRNPDVWKILTKKPVEASETELARNPRARSAKLRVAQRLPG